LALCLASLIACMFVSSSTPSIVPCRSNQLGLIDDVVHLGGLFDQSLLQRNLA
jgi:hypothetical protein